MIDYARPKEHNMCEVYSFPPPAPTPTPARLDDFQVFRRGNTPYTYPSYYSNYDCYTEPDIPLPVTVYHSLAPRDTYHEAYKTKMVTDWDEEDTVAWIVSNVIELGLQEYDVPYYNFKLTGADLYRMKRDDFTSRMIQPHIDPVHSRHIADNMFDKLQMRIREDNPVFRYADNSTVINYNLLDLDTYDKKGGVQYDYKPNDLSLLPMESICDSDFPESDIVRLSPVSQEYSCGSVESMAHSDEQNERMPETSQPTKRPPGRPKGSGKKSGKKKEKSPIIVEFLHNLLCDPRYCPAIIKWEDHSKGTFRFVKPDEVAKLWGRMRQNDNMNFEKFSRAMRYHYKQEKLGPVRSNRLVYKFGSCGPNIKTNNPNFINQKTDDYDQSYMKLEVKDSSYDSSYIPVTVKCENGSNLKSISRSLDLHVYGQV